MLIIDLKAIESTNKWFEYIKNILFGIFTGILTGLAISFYEYRQQIYSDFYTYIKQTNDCIKNVQRMITSKNYPLCIVQIESYKDTVKSSFVIRKLRRNNERVVRVIKQMFNNTDTVYEKLNEAFKISHSIALYDKQTKELYQQLLNKCSESLSEDERVKAVQKMKIDKDTIDKNLRVLEDSLESSVESCEQLLIALEKRNMELYAYVNNSKNIFLL